MTKQLDISGSNANMTPPKPEEGAKKWTVSSKNSYHILQMMGKMSDF